MPDVTVSILTYSQVALARKCIESIIAGGEEVAFILTANGNKEAEAYFNQVASRVPNVTVVSNASNEGFWKPNNHALSLTTTKYFCMVNDDLSVPKGWLSVLKKPMEEHPNSVFSCPESGCTALLHNFHGTFGAKEYCEGSCLLVDTAIAQKHGLFEPMPGMAYAEDSNASLRFRQLGYKLHWVPLRVVHARAATSRSIPEVKIWQELNHAFCRKKWEHYLKVRTFDYPIIVKRRGAYGDALLTTPIIRALKKANPISEIWVETICASVFQRNPYVSNVGERLVHPKALVIDLNGCYEANPDKNFVTSYAERAGVTLDNDSTDFILHPSNFNASQTVNESEKWIAIHPGPTWASKMWDAVKFNELAVRLRKAGFKIALVGIPITYDITNDQDFRSKLTHHELGALLKKCALFIGVDSFPMHIAQAMRTPVVGLFGVTLPEPIMTSGSPWVGVKSDPAHPASGLRHRMKHSTFTAPKENPMDTITVEQVYEAAAKFLHINEI